jgi:hypothetical protein
MNFNRDKAIESRRRATFMERERVRVTSKATSRVLVGPSSSPWTQAVSVLSYYYELWRFRFSVLVVCCPLCPFACLLGAFVIGGRCELRVSHDE